MLVAWVHLNLKLAHIFGSDVDTVEYSNFGRATEQRLSIWMGQAPVVAFCGIANYIPGLIIAFVHLHKVISTTS